MPFLHSSLLVPGPMGFRLLSTDMLHLYPSSTLGKATNRVVENRDAIVNYSADILFHTPTPCAILVARLPHIGIPSAQSVHQNKILTTAITAVQSPQIPPPLRPVWTVYTFPPPAPLRALAASLRANTARHFRPTKIAAAPPKAAMTSGARDGLDKGC